MSETWALIVVALPLVAIWVYMLVEALVRSDLSWPRRLTWAAAMLLIPILGLAFYIVVRPPKAGRVERGDPDTARAEALVEAAEARQRGDLPDQPARCAKRSRHV